ncbi:MAG: sigma-54-dependent Fis family transcriptional regulator [Candidatus Magnetomorum sp.]|nr:sigma-54-dependent Fis family transcriptional regulator [Candidatus Magnetomorum sp.]
MKKQSNLTENILIVDDKPETLSILSEILIEQGYNVRTALNVDIALKSATKFVPDLILMDVNMPGTDGFEACRIIKKMKKLQHVPVIFLTGKTDVIAKITGFEAGGVDYITKPFANEEVFMRIKTHLNIKQERERFYALAEATTEGILIHDNGIIVDVNSAFETIMQYKRKKIIDKNLNTIFSSKTMRAISQCQKKQSRFYEINDKRSDGSTLMAEIRIKSILYQGRKLNMIALRDITETKHLKRENASLMTSISSTNRLGNMVGKSKVMKNVYEKILHMAATDETVIIYGETGTGKELAAKNIQQLSQRSKKPFVIVNCAAIPDTLFESAFFGHTKGSFTNAISNSMGFFEQANGGILFLDEIGELNKNMQAKLLRIIENGEYIPIGGKKRRANVRIISATNKNLSQMVTQGKMREDFFHRLNVLNLKMPPLRERKEDVPLLVHHFVETNQSLNINNRIISDTIIVQLKEYQWPGNVRELFNELRRYYTTGELENAAYVSSPIDSFNSMLTNDFFSRNVPLNDAVSQFESYYIDKILALHNGKKNETATVLGIDPRTLYNKLNKTKPVRIRRKKQS